MNLEIRTPDKRIFEGKVKSVKVPGRKGAFMVLENHAPIISTLSKGYVEYEATNTGMQSVSIGGGVIEVQHNKIIILAENL